VKSTLGSTLLLAGLLTLFGWMGNLARERGTVSVFPDLLTLLTLPAVLYPVLRQRARREPGLGVSALRWAGMRIVVPAAVLFAASLVVQGFFRFSSPRPLLLVVGFLGALVATLVAGLLVTLASVFLITRSKLQDSAADDS
jgi:hypothetical protein